MLNHHTHPTDPIRDTKTNAFDTSMASPSRQHNFAVRVSHRYIVTAAEFGRSRQNLGVPLKMEINPLRFSEIGRSRRRLPWVVILVFEFRRSRHQRRFDPFVSGDTIMDNMYTKYIYTLYIYIYMCVSEISRQTYPKTTYSNITSNIHVNNTN